MTLRSKIVALVIGLTVALVAGLWLLLSRSWSDWAGDVVDRDLVARAEAIRAVIEVKKDGRLEFEDEHAPALSDPNHPFRVLGPGGYAVTRGNLAWPALPDPATVPPQTLTSSGPDGSRWRIVSQWMPLTHDKRPGRPEPLRAAIQVAGPAEPYTGLEDRFRHGLLLGVFGALFIGGIGGTVLVHLSLAPLRRLTTEIDQIGVTSLERRVGVERLDRELATLAKAFNDLLGRSLDHGPPDPVLDRATRVLALELEEQLAGSGVEPAELHDRRVSDEVQRRIGQRQGMLLPKGESGTASWDPSDYGGRRRQLPL